MAEPTEQEREKAKAIIEAVLVESTCQCTACQRREATAIDAIVALVAAQRAEAFEGAAGIAERHVPTHASGYRCYSGEAIAAAIRSLAEKEDAAKKCLG